MLKRNILLLLAAVMIAAAVCSVVFAEAVGEEYDNRTHYVFVIDASIKGEKGEICAAACETIRNVLPQKDARIGVIAYGYSGDDDLYAYSSVDRPNRETEYVHQILALEQADAVDGQALYEHLLQAFSADEQTSPHGQGLLAGVDMLRAAGTPMEEGCVIWITDGIKASEEWGSELNARELAVDIAKQNLWQIYTIHVDYGEANEEKQAEALRMMKEIAEATDVRTGYAPSYQRIDMLPVMDGETGAELPFLEYHEKLLEILPGEKWGEDSGSGVVHTAYTVENLTSEYTIAFIGAGVTEVSVKYPYVAAPEVYRESVVDGDVKVERCAYGFVVTLNNPDPEQWEVDAHGSGEVLVYRNVRFNVDIDLRLENENGDVLVSGKEETMRLPHEENIHFVPTYTHGDSPLIINEGISNMTAKLVIQSRKPEKEYEFRDLTEIEMPLDRGSYATEWITTAYLGQEEYHKYQERTGIYRARVVLEWTGNTYQKVAGDWILFGSENLPTVVLSEDPIERSVIANDYVEICLSERVKKEPIDQWVINLVPADGFKLVDAQGKDLDAASLETYDDVVYVQATSYVGVHDLILWVAEGNKDCQVKVQLQVTPHPQYQEDDVLDEKLYLESDWLYSLLYWLGVPVGDAMSGNELGKGVEEVRLIGEGADQIECVCVNEVLMLRPEAAGNYDLQMEIRYKAQIPDGNGGYQNQIDQRPLRLKVIRMSKWLEIGLGSVLGVSGLIVLVYLWKRKLPYALSCTLQFADKKNNLAPISEKLKREPDCSRADWKQIQVFQKDGYKRLVQCVSEHVFGIRLGHLISGFMLKREVTVTNHDDASLMKRGEMEKKLNENAYLLKKAKLQRIRLVGVCSDRYVCKITGIGRKNEFCTIKYGKIGSRQGTTLDRFSGRIPRNCWLHIELDLEKVDKHEIEKEEHEVSDALWVVRIEPHD